LTTPGDIVSVTDLEPDAIRWEPGASFDDLMDASHPASVATLGPRGTSSMVALTRFTEQVWARRRIRVEPRSYPTFDALLAAISTGDQRLALVPSAAESATRFYWSPRLRLLASFSWPTPRYGLAVRPRVPIPPDRDLRVASLPETQDLLDLLHDLAPAAGELLPRRLVTWVRASSTYDAARLAARGAADIAVTNEPGREAYGLNFVASRPGVSMIWLVFGRRPSALGEPAPAEENHG
jgi:bacilysin biosynthesis protein BacA